MARLRAETRWRALSLSHGGRLDILRLSGIYGPGRSSINYLRESGMIDRSGDVNIINRVHVHDIASAIAAAARRETASDRPDVFNVSDDLPSTSRDFFERGKQLLEGRGYTVEMSETKKGVEKSSRRIYRGSKRVDNTKMKDILGVNLKFPTYKDGLAHIAQLEL